MKILEANVIVSTKVARALIPGAWKDGEEKAVHPRTGAQLSYEGPAGFGTGMTYVCITKRSADGADVLATLNDIAAMESA